MKLMKTQDAVGQVLCHDITQIIKGVTKDAVFRKGHVITEEDIPVLLSVGKDNVYIWEKGETRLHENEAAEILREMCQGEYMHPTPVKEGKIELVADIDGLLKVDSDKMKKINGMGELMIEREKMEQAKAVCEGEPILELKPFVHKKVGIVTTGNEVYYHRIEDTFTPVIKEKLAEYDTEVIGQEICNDDHEKITKAILSFIERGADLVLCTGGMSVDPDDKTPLAIKNTGAEIVSYGAPVLPGAMFLLSYYNGNIPIIGLPGCVMYAKRTIFDLALPRIMADDKISVEELAALGEGGLCLNCPVCTFPNCGFGK